MKANTNLDRLSGNILIAFFITACHTGNLDEKCNSDGTCNGENLECHFSRCMIRYKPEPVVVKRCNFESECFCIACAEKCGDAGVKMCSFSDTSVWGSKPSVCECK